MSGESIVDGAGLRGAHGGHCALRGERCDSGVGDGGTVRGECDIEQRSHLDSDIGRAGNDVRAIGRQSGGAHGPSAALSARFHTHCTISIHSEACSLGEHEEALSSRLRARQVQTANARCQLGPLTHAHGD